jgi:uncharacterized protein YndB with AHSA1/START domain
VIRCQVLEAEPHARLAYSWVGGHEAITSGYGTRLNTVVTWTLTGVEAGTRLRLVHAGFVAPRNDHALQVMGNGWKTVLGRIDALIGEEGL